MNVRAMVLSGMLALAGLIGSANKADAQVVFSIGSGYPYGYYGSYVSPYWNYTWPPATSYYSPYWGGLGYSSPYWYGRSYSYYSPFGTRAGSYYYANPGYGPGLYSYRWNRWRW